MHITPEPKAHLQDQCILPFLTYSAKTWVCTNEISHKLRAAQRAIERNL